MDYRIPQRVEEILHTVGAPSSDDDADDKARTLIHALCLMLGSISDFDDPQKVDLYVGGLARHMSKQIASCRAQLRALEGRKPS